MDIYKEQLVVKKATSSDWVKRIAILFGAGILVLGCVAALPFSGQFWFFPVLVICILLYAVFHYYPLLYTEYEYIFTNGEIDFDKIMGRQTRKRLATVDVAFFEEFGRFEPAAFEGREFDTKLYACSAPTDPGTYYAVLSHPKLQRCLIVFNPNETIVESIKEYLPRTAKVNV
jgi:hypothetical protein